MRIRPLACLATALALAVLPACSDDESDDTASAATSEPTGSSSAPSGDALHVGLIANTTSLEPLKQGAQIAIEAINAAGGVKGRPLELVACDNQLNANGAAACARQMANDPKLMATVGSVSSFGGDTNPVLEKAEIAGIGTALLGAGDFNSPAAFPITPGGQVIVAGAVLLADELKATKPGVIVVDTPTANALPGLIDSSIFSPRGLKLAASASIPQSAADVAPQAAAVADTDGVVVSVTNQLMIRYVRTARQQGYEGDLVISGTEASPASVSADLNGVNEDLYVITGFERDSDGFRELESDVKKYDPAAPLNDTVAAAYLSVKVFAEVAEDLETIDRAAVLEAMNNMKDFSTDGMTLPLDFTTPGTALGGNAPRLVDHAAVGYAYRFENSEFVPVGARPLKIYASN